MRFLDILFPKKCVACGRIGEYICTSCFTLISFDSKQMCLVCGGLSIDGRTHPGCRTRYSIDGAYCAVAYNSVVRKMIFRFKYKPFLADLADTCGGLFYESLIQQESFMRVGNKNKNIRCVPIPLHPNKFRTRGYNQSQILAKILSEKFGWYLTDCLERIRETKPQFGLKKEKRAENMKGAFAFLKKSYLKRGDASTSSLRPVARDDLRCAFLVDDVLTTGTTLSEAANILKHNGVYQVWGLCFAGDSRITL